MKTFIKYFSSVNNVVEMKAGKEIQKEVKHCCANKFSGD